MITKLLYNNAIKIELEFGVEGKSKLLRLFKRLLLVREQVIKIAEDESGVLISVKAGITLGTISL